jgi:hypothetical protein
MIINNVSSNSPIYVPSKGKCSYSIVRHMWISKGFTSPSEVVKEGTATLERNINFRYEMHCHIFRCIIANDDELCEKKLQYKFHRMYEFAV